MSNKIFEMFKNKSTEGVRVSQGFGSLGPWPPVEPGKTARVVQVAILGYTEKDNAKYLWWKDDDKKGAKAGELPAASIQFHYYLPAGWDGERGGKEMNIDGRSFIIPLDETPLANHPKAADRARWDQGRFLGHCKTVTGMDFNDLGTAWVSAKETIDKALASQTPLVVKALLTYDKDDQTPNKEFLQELVS